MREEEIEGEIGIQQTLDLDARRERRGTQPHRGVDRGFRLIGEPLCELVSGTADRGFRRHAADESKGHAWPYL